jgi:hypothetical protein
MGRFVLILLLMCVASSAEARSHHHRHARHHAHRIHIAAQPACQDVFCWFGTQEAGPAVAATRARQPRGKGSYAPSWQEAAGRPSRFIAGRLICAVNVNAALAERGIRGTGSAWAKSFLSWGISAGGPVPGAVIVSSRRGGGHVAIVSRVEGGVVYAWNATGGQRGWREIPYRHPVLDYRVPG